MTNLTFTTPRGANIEIVAKADYGFSALVNGQPHTNAGAEFRMSDVVKGEKIGPHVALQNLAKAVIRAEDVARVRAWFAEAMKVQNDRAAKEYYTENRMRDMHSRYSVN